MLTQRNLIEFRCHRAVQKMFEKAVLNTSIRKSDIRPKIIDRIFTELVFKTDINNYRNYIPNNSSLGVGDDNNYRSSFILSISAEDWVRKNNIAATFKKNFTGTNTCSINTNDIEKVLIYYIEHADEVKKVSDVVNAEKDIETFFRNLRQIKTIVNRDYGTSELEDSVKEVFGESDGQELLKLIKSMSSEK